MGSLDEVEMAARTSLLVNNICEDMGLAVEISPAKIFDLAHAFTKDLNRIVSNQLHKNKSDGVSIYKYAGYWAFWIRKTKPITYAVKKSNLQIKPSGEYGSSDFQDELLDINERVALEIALSLIVLSRKENLIEADTVRFQCSKKEICDGSQCLIKYWRELFNFNEKGVLNYLIYSMRYRTFGPHHFVLMLQIISHGACNSYSN